MYLNRMFHKISIDQWRKDTVYTEDTHFKIKMPKRATIGSAGYDFFSPIDFVLKPGETMKIPTGLKVEMWDDEFLLVLPRSGLGFKYFVRLANTAGIIDCDYFNNSDNEGHIFIKVRNEGLTDLEIKAGSAFAQGIFMEFRTTDDDEAEMEREGGLGSTS